MGGCVYEVQDTYIDALIAYVNRLRNGFKKKRLRVTTSRQRLANETNFSPLDPTFLPTFVVELIKINTINLLFLQGVLLLLIVLILSISRIWKGLESVGTRQTLLQGWLLCVGFVCLANVPDLVCRLILA